MIIHVNIPGLVSRSDLVWNESVSTLRQFNPEIESDGLSVTGPVRDDNQDSIHLPDSEKPAGPGLLFAVADGMGGYAHGGVASLLTLETFSKTLASQNGISIAKALQRCVEHANLQVFQTSQQLGVGRMGSTLTAAYVLGNTLYLAHVGDSRAYLIRNQRVTCLSADHTVVGDMVRSKLISPDKIRTHAQRSVLTKAIGVSLFVQPDITKHRLQEGDHFILCSDGVWSVVEDEDFARIVVAKTDSVKSVSQKLVDLAIQNETDDNASVVVFHVNKLIPESSGQGIKDRKVNHWFEYLRKWVS